MENNRSDIEQAELLSQIREPTVMPSTTATAETKQEITFWNQEQEKAKLNDFLQDINLRRSYSLRIFVLICIYLGIVCFLLIGCAHKRCPLELSDSVLIALLTTTTISVIGLFTIVANYVFPKRDKN